jgi:hypothetical protein
VRPEIPSIEKKLEYFQSDKIKELFKSVLQELSGRQIEVKPIHSLWISFWYRGKRFMYMAPARNFFVVQVLKTDGTWSGRVRVSNQKEWTQLYQGDITNYMQYLDANKQVRES